MKTMLELITTEMEAAFEKAGYDKELAKVTLSNRPDLCEYQCNGAMAAAKEYKKAPFMIADEVVAIVAGLAATDVDGVASMAGNITNELVSKLGMKNLSKGVKVEVLDGVVTVDLTLNIEYGMNILETSKKVQEKVKAAIENMTGLEVADVNIHIASVDMENEKGK